MPNPDDEFAPGVPTIADDQPGNDTVSGEAFLNAFLADDTISAPAGDLLEPDDLTDDDWLGEEADGTDEYDEPEDGYDTFDDLDAEEDDPDATDDIPDDFEV